MNDGSSEAGSVHKTGAEPSSTQLILASQKGLLVRVGRRVELIERLLGEIKKRPSDGSGLEGLAAGKKRMFGGIECAWCPAGTFRMGSPEEEEDRWDDETLHTVTLTLGFWLSDHQTIQQEYEAVMGSNPSRFKGADRPVETMSWDESVEFCRKLTDQQRKQGMLPEGWAWRLPTEAEWEYAARAGTAGPRHGELDAIAWHSGNSGSETHPVKQKVANAWGLFDMLGNVWKWCSDWYGDYPTGAMADPTGPNSGSRRVARGGSWRYGARDCRSAFRRRDDPGNRSSNLGFRPVLSSVR